MPEYRLTYFNAMGRAEPIRLLFAQAGEAYKDVRIERSDWPTKKQEFPFEQLPVLEVDGKMLSQSRSIERFLAKKFGLGGKDDWEEAKVDELVMGVEDLLVKMQPWFKETNETAKIEIFKKLIEEEIHPFLGRYEKFLIKNETGFFVGDQVTLADLEMFHILFFMDHKLLPRQISRYPQLSRFLTRIQELPNIRMWLIKRPKTEA